MPIYNPTGSSGSGGGMSIGGTVTSGNSGSVLFVDGSGNLAQDTDLTFANDTLTATKLIAPTSITSPLVIGGTAVGSVLSLQATTGNGTSTTSSLQFLVGNNGATKALEVLNSGFVGIGTTTGTFNVPATQLYVLKDTAYGDQLGVAFFGSKTNAPNGIYLGYDDTLDGGYIQAIRRTSAFKPLFINPNGGAITLGGTSIPDAFIQMNGTLSGGASTTLGTDLQLWIGGGSTNAASAYQIGFGYQQHGGVQVASGYFSAQTIGDEATHHLPLDFVWGLRPDTVNYTTATEVMRLHNNGSLDLTNVVSKYKNISTVAWGVPAIYGSGRSTAQTAAVASVATYTVGAADGSFLISSNVNVTTSTAHSFTVTCAYTDETNTARTLTLSFIQIGGGTPIATITNITGAGPYEGVPNHIRCKASTAITIATTGTFTTVTYNVEGSIIQLS